MSQIDTERLQLRFPLTDADPRHVEWLNDKQLMRWSEQRWKEHDYDTQRQFLVDALVEGNPLCFDIILQEGTAQPAGDYGRSIGTIHAHLDKRHRRADIGIMLGPQYHGKGYAKEAWEAVEKHLRLAEGIHKFEGGCASGNTAMIALFEMLGYVKEGWCRNHFVIDNRPYALAKYGNWIP